ncbi:nudix hydrolase [Listeria phage LIS04]|nr:nudix hydrolase [Listeria phage LIS04]
MSSKWEEKILVAPRSVVFENESITFQGVTRNEEDISRIIKNVAKSFTVMRRGNSQDTTPEDNNAEVNTSYKQPIPYAVIQCGSEVFTYRRLSGGGESRLHDKLSIGVGGHMNELVSEGSSFSEEISENLKRELEEELVIDLSTATITPIGIINDDSDDVSVVHLGILYTIEVPSPAEVDVREKDQLEGTWYSIEELKSKSIYDRLESWSKIAVSILE